METPLTPCRCGIYGGSFNPIHNGHTQLGKALCKGGWVDELWFMLSPQNPLKQEATDLLPDADRLALARLAVAGDPRLRVSDFECALPRPSYMAHTLEALRKTFPEREFVLVIGADNWLDFHRWHQPEEILAHHRVVVYPRPHYPIRDETLPQGVSLADTPLIDLSSTSIRQQIAQGTYDGEGIHPAVWEEIQRKGYYR